MCKSSGRRFLGSDLNNCWRLICFIDKLTVVVAVTWFAIPYAIRIFDASVAVTFEVSARAKLTILTILTLEIKFLLTLFHYHNYLLRSTYFSTNADQISPTDAFALTTSQFTGLKCGYPASILLHAVKLRILKSECNAFHFFIIAISVSRKLIPVKPL